MVTTNTNKLAIHFNEEQGMLRDSAREFCSKRSDIQAVRALLGSEAGYDDSVWRELVSLGWMGVAIPEEYGGSGLGIGSAVPLAECMGKSLLSTPFFSSVLASQALLRGGSARQREQWLPAIVKGCVASVAVLESEDWGDESVSMTATAAGETLVLSGTKTHVADASVAELFLVPVEFESKRCLLLVPATLVAEGAIQPQTLIDETKRCARVDFSGVVVPVGNILPGDYAAVMRDICLIGALLHASEATGSAYACLDLTVEYLKTRKQFGRLIGSYQALKHPMVEGLCAIDAAKSFIYHAATIMDESPLDTDAEIACRMAKAQASEALKFVGDRAVQFHGGMGFTYECDTQLYIRRAQWAQQVFGDAYHHRKRLAPLLL